MTDVAARCGISLSYLSMLRNGHRVPRLELALKIWKAGGPKLGALLSLSDADCDLLSRTVPAAPADPEVAA
jgi:transcriptional regulator with XRE-family HTH domain